MIYDLRKPKRVDPNKTYPALFLIHGMGSNEQNMFQLVQGLEEDFYIFSIRGPISQPPGFAFFTIEGYGKPHREVFDQAVSSLTNFIEYATKQYSLDQNKLFLLGFSQGAILSMTLGLTLGERIKGVIALSGYIPQFVKDEYSIKSVSEMSLFISHGKMDQVLPYEWGEVNNDYFQELGASVTFKSYREGHTVSLQNYNDFNTWLLNSLGK